MKRIILSLFCFTLMSFGAIAQIDINPGSIVLEAASQDQIFIDIFITNNSSDDVEVYWNYEPAGNYPENWKTQICDLNLCYNWDTFISSNGLPNAISAGEEVKFTLKVQNVIDGFLVDGSSFGILRLFDDQERLNEVASTSGVTSTVDISAEDIVIFPNPTTEMFQLKNDATISSISIYNIVGRLIQTFNHNKGMVHDVTSLRSGMYLVRLENKNGDVVKSMRLSKK